MNRLLSKENILNFIYFTVIFAAAFGISSLALYRKINAYSATDHGLKLSVVKDEAKVDSLISGRIQSVKVEEGQIINVGEELFHIEPTNAEFASETVTLTEEGLYIIYSPISGTVSEINTTVGSSVRPELPLVSLFSADNIKLMAKTNRDEYLRLQKRPELRVYNDRLQRSFDVEYEGISKVNLTDGMGEEYNLLFSVNNDDNAQAMINGETVVVIPNVEVENTRPEQIIVDFWNKFLVGNQ